MTARYECGDGFTASHPERVVTSNVTGYEFT